MSDSTIVCLSVEDPDIFGLLFDRHGSTIARYLKRRIGDAADGLTAEVFVIAFEHRARFVDLRDGSARPWLFGIASNLLRRHYRQERRHLRALARLRTDSADCEHVERVDEQLDSAVALQAAAVVIGTLRKDERDVVLLIAWEELSEAEVAAALCIPIGTVKSRLSRARRKIRERVAASGHQLLTTSIPLHAQEDRA